MAKAAIAQPINPVIQQAQYLRRVALVVDTETTGSSQEKDEVIELGMVRASNGEVLISQRFRPSKKIEPFAYRVHGISDRALANEPFFAARWPEHSSLFNGAVIVGWNIAYDRRMIEATCERYGLKAPSAEWVDLMPLYRDFKRATKNCKLSEACAEMGVTAGTHSAKSDALAAARVLYKMAGPETAESQPAVQVELSDPTVTHQWEVAEVSEYYENADSEAEDAESPQVAQIEIPSGLADAYLMADGCLCIPSDARPALKYWLPGAQTIWQTLVDLSADAVTVRRYAMRLDALVCRHEAVAIDGLLLCVECGHFTEAPVVNELERVLGF